MKLDPVLVRKTNKVFLLTLAVLMTLGSAIVWISYHPAVMNYLEYVIGICLWGIVVIGLAIALWTLIYSEVMWHYNRRDQ